MTFQRTKNAELVRYIMTHPSVYPHISDDGCPPVEDFVPMMHPAIWHVVVEDEGQVLGLWIVTPQGAACAEIHTCLLPCSYGARASKAVKAAIAWLFENSQFQRLFTNVPDYNRLALRFAKQAGMEVFGVNVRSYLKGGKLYDQILLGLSRSGVTCQQQ